ncbi:MAG: DNA-binding protein [Alphaproteobacteria bacterium]|nr:DNA-binding protein [Alphaproteobacteria bacterium]
MNIKPIKTEVDYEATLERIGTLFDAKPNTPKGDELEILVTLVSSYEDEHYKIDVPDPVEAIKHIMEAQEMHPQDMIKFLGSSSKVSEVMNKKRGLSLSMIRKLTHGLHIPADILVAEYELSQ